MKRRPATMHAVVVAAAVTVALLLSLSPAPRVAAAQNDARNPPSLEQLRAMYDRGEYQPLLQQLQRVLSLKGDAAKTYNRAQVLLLKADAHLQLKAPAPALAAAKDAREAATEPDDVARATAIELLLRKAQGLQYIPRGDGKVRGEPIDLAADREAALLALLDDETITIQPKLEQLRRKRTLPAVVEAVELIQPLRAVEMTATGKTEKSDGLLEGMGDYAADLIDDALETMDKRSAEIERSANTIIQLQSERGLQAIRFKKKGIQSREAKELKTMLDTCGKLVPASRELAEVFPAERSRFAGASGEAVKLATRVNAVLEEDYSRTYRDPDNIR